MTHNQLQYWANLEAARANRAKEGLTYMQNVETNRSNLVNEGIKRDTLTETSRHNYATEDLGIRQLNESQRHNVATETNTAFANREQKRHNIVTESQTDFSNTEIRRHNKVAEAYSFATLPIQQQQANAASAQASAALQNATSNQMNAYTKQYEANTGRAQAINRIVQDYGDDWNDIPVVGKFMKPVIGTGGFFMQPGMLGGTAGDYYTNGVTGDDSNVPIKSKSSATAKITKSNNTTSKHKRSHRKR